MSGWRAMYRVARSVPMRVMPRISRRYRRNERQYSRRCGASSASSWPSWPAAGDGPSFSSSSSTSQISVTFLISPGDSFIAPPDVSAPRPGRGAGPRGRVQTKGRAVSRNDPYRELRGGRHHYPDEAPHKTSGGRARHVYNVARLQHEVLRPPLLDRRQVDVYLLLRGAPGQLPHDFHAAPTGVALFAARHRDGPRHRDRLFEGDGPGLDHVPDDVDLIGFGDGDDVARPHVGVRPGLAPQRVAQLVRDEARRLGVVAGDGRGRPLAEGRVAGVDDLHGPPGAIRGPVREGEQLQQSHLSLEFKLAGGVDRADDRHGLRLEFFDEDADLRISQIFQIACGDRFGELAFRQAGRLNVTFDQGHADHAAAVDAHRLARKLRAVKDAHVEHVPRADPVSLIRRPGGRLRAGSGYDDGRRGGRRFGALPLG